MVTYAQLRLGQQVSQPYNNVKLDTLQRRMQDAGMVMYTTHADESMPTAKTLPLIVLLQDLLACQDQDPRVEYQQADELQDLVHAMKSCNGLVLGRNFQVNQALTIAQLLGSVLLLLSEHSQLDTLEIDKVVQKHLLLQCAAARHMPQLLSLLLPFMNDSTACTALNALAVGLEPFKAEGDAQKAVAALASIGAFIQGLLPALNDVLGKALYVSESTNLSLMCDLLTSAIKTFKSAVEVSMRELGEEQDVCGYLAKNFESMSYISTLLNWRALVSSVHLRLPQCTAMLQSLLEIEVIWSLSVATDAKYSKSVPMLQGILDDSSGVVDALYKLLPTEESQAETDTPNSSLLGLVFLIKAITKAAVLLRAKSQAVTQMFLSPVSASSDYWGSPNVLEVLWYLLTIHGTKAAVACRVIETYALCVQQTPQRTPQWPKVSECLLKHMRLPTLTIEQLQNLTASLKAAKAANNRDAWQAAAEQKALMLSMAKMLLDNVTVGLSRFDRDKLKQLYTASLPSKPLWDGKTIEYRPAVNPDAINTGDEAPSSWDGPHLQADTARQAQCNALQAQDEPSPNLTISTDTRVSSQSQGASMTESAEAIELRARMEETKQKIAAAKARKSKKKLVSSEKQQNPGAEVPPGKPKQPTNSDQHGNSPHTAESSSHPDNTDATVPILHVPTCGSVQSANSMPLSTVSLQQGHLAHFPTPVIQYTSTSSYSCKAPANNSNAQAQAAQSLGSHSQMDQTILDSARRRSSHAGLATAATQQRYNAIVNNPPEVLRQPYANEHCAGRCVFAVPPGPQHLSSQTPPHQESMTRAPVTAEMHSSPCLQTSLLTHSQDTAAPMEIDSASNCHPFYAALTMPFEPKPWHACGYPSGSSVNGADNSSASCHHTTSDHACAPTQSIHDDGVDLMEIDINVC